MILLDTSALVDSLCGCRPAGPDLDRILESGEPLGIPSLVLYEWYRGPRTAEELSIQEELVPAERAIQFGPEEAALSARLYQAVKRPREREIDIAIAATAIRHEAMLWTLNEADFRDIPGLRLYQAK